MPLGKLALKDLKTLITNRYSSMISVPGLDIPYLPEANYTGSDITPAMLTTANNRSIKYKVPISLICTDSPSLAFKDESFDIIVMHLILAVVPDPVLALKEACRVLKPGGIIYLLDKFIRPGQIAIIRRLINIPLRHIATRTDVVFERTLQQVRN